MLLRRLAALLIILVLLFTAVPIHAQGGPQTVTLTEDNNGDTVSLETDDILRIELAANATTGYDWFPITEQWVNIERAQVTVYEVPEGTPAAQAGFQKDDIIRSINGDPVVLAQQLNDLLRQFSGQTVLIQALRGEETIDFTLEVPDDQPEDTTRLYVFDRVEDMPAAEAGVQIEDVIIAVDGITLTSVEQLIEYVQAHEGEEITLTILREGETFDIALTPRADAEGIVRIGLAVTEIHPSAIGLVAVDQHITVQLGLIDPSGDPDRVILELLSVEYIPDENAAEAEGAGGTSVWTFRAVAAGDTALQLGFAATYEEEPEPVEIFEITIQIEEGDNPVNLPSSLVPVEVSDGDNGQTIRAQVGSQIVIRLAANATTGYEWVLESVNEPILEQQGDPIYEGPGENAMPGAGGTSIWTFTAVVPGETTLHLIYIRPWEDAPEPAQEFQITVQVD